MGAPQLVMPEWCAWCFSLREARSGMWISTAADNKREASWVLSSEKPATIMHRVQKQQQLNQPWQRHPHLHTLLPGLGERCAHFDHFYKDLPIIVWGACPSTSRFQFAAANTSAGGGGASKLPSTSVVCVRRASSNLTSYMGVLAAAAEESTQRILLVGAPSQAIEVEWQCVPCPHREFTGATAGWTVLIVLVAILPALAVRRFQQRPLVRGRSSGQQWPKAARSNFAWSLLLLGWLSIMLGFSPMILASTDGWWTGRESYYLVLCIMGVALMAMFMRDDDPKCLFGAISLALTVAFMGGTALNTVNVFTLVQNLFQHLRAGEAPTGSGPESAGADGYLLATRYALFARLVPQLGKGLLLEAVNVVYIMASLAANLQPLVCRRAAASETGASALHRFWRHMHLFLGGLALSLLGTCIATVGIASAMRHTAYPSELERTKRNLWEDGTIGLVVLLCIALTSPKMRLRVHMPLRLRLRKHTVLSANALALHVDTRSTAIATVLAPSLMELGATAGQMEGAIDTGPAGTGDGTAGAHSLAGSCWPSPPPSALAAYRPPVLIENDYGPPNEWADVDVNAWQDISGRFDGMQVGRLVGSGGYSKVFLAELPPRPSSGAVGAEGGEGGVGGEGSPRLVAVKVFQRSAYKDEQEVGNLRREVAIALEVSHPHLVRTLGMVLIDGGHGYGRPGLVMELKSGGSLAQLLHGPSLPSSATPTATHTASTEGGDDGASHGIDRLSPRGRRQPVREKRPVLAAELRQRLVHEVLSGLAYLHELSLIHRDIKTANVLLDDDLHAAVCDFGISTRFGMELTMCVGTLRYMAPEVCFGPYDAKADVFAYAMLLWETLHVAIPFGESQGYKALLCNYNGQRPAIQLAPPLDRYEELIQRCWHQSPEMRPSMTNALALMEGLMEQHA